MKARQVVSVTVILLGLVVAGSVSMAHASNYLGEFCWQGPDGGVGKFGVFAMEGGHFFIAGKIMPLGGGVSEVAIGNAEIVGSQVIMVLTSIGGDASSKWGGIMRIVLNLNNNLNGTVEGMGLDHSNSGPAGNVSPYYDSVQNLTFITCP